ncbi:MAG TPA: hypothetical protein VIY48_01035 [Candidatus Paceibacterota bacterium]
MATPKASKTQKMASTKARSTGSGQAPEHKKIAAPTKTFQQDGHWVVKPRKTPILICDCGNRYLKTRPGQSVCLRCLFKPLA